jgi:hypothetical protein
VTAPTAWLLWRECKQTAVGSTYIWGGDRLSLLYALRGRVYKGAFMGMSAHSWGSSGKRGFEPTGWPIPGHIPTGASQHTFVFSSASRGTYRLSAPLLPCQGLSALSFTSPKRISAKGPTTTTYVLSRAQQVAAGAGAPRMATWK